MKKAVNNDTLRRQLADKLIAAQKNNETNKISNELTNTKPVKQIVLKINPPTNTPKIR